MSLEQPKMPENKGEFKRELYLDLETLIERISSIEKPDEKQWTEEKWKEKDLNLTEEFKQRRGPLIEVGGPTNQGYAIVGDKILKEFRKNFLVSNITPGIPVEDDDGNFLYYSGGIDFHADAEHLPFRDNSLGALFASCLPQDIREKTIKEAVRVLEDKGLFVFQGGFENDIPNIETAGFKIIKYNKLFIDNEFISIHAIFRKISDKKEVIEKEAVEDLKDLGLDFDYLKNKLTLDIGAGPAVIAEAAKKKGIEVVSLDINPDMWVKEGRKIPDVPYIKASAEKLPFKDEMFDLIISHAGPFSNTPSKEIIIKILTETKRVLKKGGELRFGPGNLNANIFTSEELFSPEENELFTIEQRVERIRQKSLEFLRSIDPNVAQKIIKESSYDFPLNHFYILEK